METIHNLKAETFLFWQFHKLLQFMTILFRKKSEKSSFPAVSYKSNYWITKRRTGGIMIQYWVTCHTHAVVFSLLVITVGNCTLTTAPTDREHLTGSVRFQAVRTRMSTRISRATMPISWMSRMIWDIKRSHSVNKFLSSAQCFHPDAETRWRECSGTVRIFVESAKEHRDYEPRQNLYIF